MQVQSAIRQPQKFLWSNQFQLPFESAFVTLQKFAWANVLTGAQVARQVFGRVALPANPGHLDLFEGRWINPASRRFPNELSLKEGLAQKPTLQWMKLLCRTDTLRFCERCLAEGFHSLFFQIEGIARCPRHRVEFRSSCAKCYAAVPLALSQGAFAQPFHCSECQQPLAPRFHPETWMATPEAVADIEHALTPIATWLADLASYSVNVTRSPLRQLSLAGAFQDEPESLVNFSIAQRFVRLDLPEGTCRLSKRPLWAFQMKPPSRKTTPVSALKSLQLRIVYFRSLRNNLLKTVLHPHRSCLARARDKVWLRGEFGRQILQQEPNVCPVAAGFLHWKMKFWLLAQEQRKFDPALMSVSVDPPGERFVMRMLAEFYSSVASAYIHEQLNRRGGRLNTDIGTPHRDLLEHLCIGTDSAACWMVRKSSNSQDFEWMVMGTADLLRDIGVSERCSIERLRLCNLVVWPILNRL